MPHSIAVDRNGKIFVSTKPNGLGCMVVRLWPDISCSSASGYSPVYEIDPVTFAAKDRRVFFTNQETFLKASADRSTIVGVTGGSSGGPVHVYSAATDSFRTVNLNAYLSTVAVDATGSLFLVPNSSGSFVLDANLNVVGRVQGLERSSAPVIDSNKRIAYQVGVDGIYVVDLSTFSRRDVLSAGDGLEQAIHGGNNYSALSSDGTLIAVVSNHGFSIVRTDGGKGGGGPTVEEPPRSSETPSVIAYSSKSPDGQSVFRFYNGDAFSGRVRVTLSDLRTGEAIAEWDSPYLSPGTSGQFSVQSFEERAGPDFVPPPRYMVSIRSEVNGAFTHVLWDRNSTIVNLPTCDTGALDPQRLIANVYPSALDHAQPSSLAVFNLANVARPVTLGIYSAETGEKLGTYLSEVIKPGTGKVLPIYALEVGAGISRAKASSHHVVKIEGEFSGYIQHFQYDPRVNIIGDMTPACRLVGSPK
ncbi:MAG: hypothetical protein AB7H70_00060 [Rhodospirillaceae bacterium]